MLEPVLKKNDQLAYILIGVFSAIVLAVVTFLSKFTLDVELPFDKHIFALINAVINSAVAILLIAGLIAVKQKNYTLHKSIMLTAMVLSLLFLVTYIAHHLLAGEAKFGDANFDGLVDDAEKAVLGNTRPFYLILLGTHIILAATSLPFILFTAYRALTSDFAAHKNLSKKVWPIWFYVAVTGPIVYLMIKQYYN
jgi:putative membrane protein